ncbi:hypothetical protein BDW75DRAFT_91046 [Aspergillus navahoensis]
MRDGLVSVSDLRSFPLPSGRFSFFVSPSHPPPESFRPLPLLCAASLSRALHLQPAFLPSLSAVGSRSKTGYSCISLEVDWKGPVSQLDRSLSSFPGNDCPHKYRAAIPQLDITLRTKICLFFIFIFYFSPFLFISSF